MEQLPARLVLQRNSLRGLFRAERISRCSFIWTAYKELAKETVRLFTWCMVVG